MLTDADVLWLKENYPELIPNDSKTQVRGKISFIASYNEETKQFLILTDPDKNRINGLVLKGTFNIEIKRKGEDASGITALPYVFVDQNEIVPITNRHFNSGDKSACLCGPIEEQNYIEQGFEFPFFLHRLIIPFLYGQAYYDLYNRWPWAEYSHGVTGALESYSIRQNSSLAFICLEKMKIDNVGWLRVKPLLSQNKIKGHTSCVCGSNDQIRRCHPIAWKGLIQLKADIKNQGIQL